MSENISLKDYERLIECRASELVIALGKDNMLESKDDKIDWDKKVLYGDDLLSSAMLKYDLIFPDDGFPAIPLLEIYADKELIEMINDCLDRGKTLEELGYYTPPPLDGLI